MKNVDISIGMQENESSYKLELFTSNVAIKFAYRCAILEYA
jgi:hypothetical protein